MSDDREMRRLSGGSRECMTSIAVAEVDGAPVVVGADNGGGLRRWDLSSGKCVRLPLELDAAGLEDEWYDEMGWVEEDRSQKARAAKCLPPTSSRP